MPTCRHKSGSYYDANSVFMPFTLMEKDPGVLRERNKFTGNSDFMTPHSICYTTDIALCFNLLAMSSALLQIFSPIIFESETRIFGDLLFYNASSGLKRVA